MTKNGMFETIICFFFPIHSTWPHIGQKFDLTRYSKTHRCKSKQNFGDAKHVVPICRSQTFTFFLLNQDSLNHSIGNKGVETFVPEFSGILEFSTNQNFWACAYIPAPAPVLRQQACLIDRDGCGHESLHSFWTFFEAKALVPCAAGHGRDVCGGSFSKPLASVGGRNEPDPLSCQTRNVERMAL